MASKLGGHSLIRDPPPLRKVGGPLTPRTSRIAATGTEHIFITVSIEFITRRSHLRLQHDTLHKTSRGLSLSETTKTFPQQMHEINCLSHFTVQTV